MQVCTHSRRPNQTTWKRLGEGDTLKGSSKGASRRQGMAAGQAEVTHQHTSILSAWNSPWREGVLASSIRSSLINSSENLTRISLIYFNSVNSLIQAQLIEPVLCPWFSAGHHRSFGKEDSLYSESLQPSRENMLNTYKSDPAKKRVELGLCWEASPVGPGVGTGRRCPAEAPPRLRPGSWRWSGQEGMSGALGTGNKVSAALAARPRPGKAQGLSAPALLETPSLFCLSKASLPFSGLCLRGCGATFGKYQHRGFLWPCSGPSSLNLFATVCFTGPCTLTQLLTLISWLRRSDGWKPRCCDWRCPGSEGLFQPPCQPSSDA